jgi:hypothetical protein
MMAKWLVAAALCGGLTATVPASPVAPRTEPAVKVEIRGRLHVLGSKSDGSGDGRCLPPSRTYEIEARGQRFYLNIWRFAAEADELDGTLVIVAGTLDLDTVNVTGLTVPKDEALRQYVRVTVEGQLRAIPREFPPYDQTMWHIQAGGRSFSVRFANARVEAQAAGIQGLAVILTGDLEDGQILVHSLRTEIPLQSLDPMPSMPPSFLLPDQSSQRVVSPEA